MAIDYARKHLVVGLSKVKSTKVGHIYSLIDEANDIDNGELVTVGTLATGEREIRNAGTPVKTSKGVVLVTTPALNPDTSTSMKSADFYFYNKSGEVMRAHELGAGDIYEVSVEAITALGDAVVENNYVVLKGRKLEEVASLAGTEGFVGRIEFTRTYGANDTRATIYVVQN